MVSPRKGYASVDLKEVMDELQVRDISAPVLLRFPDILDNRIEKISNCFHQASEQYGYTAQNFMIYPIKVNQMRQVVEEIVSYGKKFNIGLEAGSKPELHAVLATNIAENALIICNGYKDESYIELALLAQKMGRRIYLVVEKLNELRMIAEISKRLKVRLQCGHSHQIVEHGFRQMERERGRPKQVRPQLQRAAGGDRHTRPPRHEGLPEAHTLPHRQPDQQDTRYQKRSARQPSSMSSFPSLASA